MSETGIFWLDGHEGEGQGGYYLRNDLFKFFQHLKDAGKKPVGIRIDDSWRLEIIVESMNKKHCLGCDEDFYNDKNPYGIKVCWLLRDAKRIMRKRVRMDERPPWKSKPERLPNCYRQKGYVFVDPEVNK